MSLWSSSCFSFLFFLNRVLKRCVARRPLWWGLHWNHFSAPSMAATLQMLFSEQPKPAKRVGKTKKKNSLFFTWKLASFTSLIKNAPSWERSLKTDGYYSDLLSLPSLSALFGHGAAFLCCGLAPDKRQDLLYGRDMQVSIYISRIISPSPRKALQLLSPGTL